ncbi:MAG TPA: glycosyltransferase [Thermodesulfovibrionales bacterium]|nr:glycosyltransferase [Thermodesulfovibrionales bacterium]
MSSPLRITYLLESTELWGGTKVALEQAELLSDAGYKVVVLSKDTGPTWYPFKLSVIQVPHFDASTIPESNIVIGTYWPTVKAAVEAGKGIAVHLCQGYEGGFKELYPFKAAIDEVYSYRIPKLTVSPHMNKFLIERFNAETYYVGQMLNRDIFHPVKVSTLKEHLDILNVLVIGPFDADVKNIRTALNGISMARLSLSIPLKLIRVSQFALSDDEKKIIKPYVYHFHVPHLVMGEIYRKADLLVSMSKEEEGFGLPPLEAMGCGIPTILSRIPSHLSYDDPQDYAVFVESTPGAVSKAILAVSESGELRERLRRRGLSVAERFTKESVLLRLFGAFSKIVPYRI